MQAKYRVHYFPQNGRVVNIRTLLYLGKADWENNLIEFSEWPALKASGKYEGGMVPALEVNGKLLSQTTAIELYLAKIFNFMGANAEEDYHITNVLGVRDDCFTKVFQVLMPNEEQKSQMDTLIKHIKETMFPNMLKTMEKKYIENGQGKYYIGNKLTLADIFLANTFSQFFESKFLKEHFNNLPSEYSPKLWAYIQNLKQNDMKDYFENVYLKDVMF